MTGYAVKHSIRAEDIRILRKKLKLTQKDFAKLVNVSQKTIERWESENRDITGPVTTLVHILNEYPHHQFHCFSNISFSPFTSQTFGLYIIHFR